MGLASTNTMTMARPQALSSWRRDRPVNGWRGRPAFVNPRSPAVTARLAQELTLEGYFAAAALMGLIAAQEEEPDPAWVEEWTMKMGIRMAAAERRRQRGLRVVKKSKT